MRRKFLYKNILYFLEAPVIETPERRNVSFVSYHSHADETLQVETRPCLLVTLTLKHFNNTSLYCELGVITLSVIRRTYLVPLA